MVSFCISLVAAVKRSEPIVLEHWTGWGHWRGCRIPSVLLLKLLWQNQRFNIEETQCGTIFFKYLYCQVDAREFSNTMPFTLCVLFPQKKYQHGLCCTPILHVIYLFCISSNEGYQPTSWRIFSGLNTGWHYKSLGGAADIITFRTGECGSHIETSLVLIGPVMVASLSSWNGLIFITYLEALNLRNTGQPIRKSHSRDIYEGESLFSRLCGTSGSLR